MNMKKIYRQIAKKNGVSVAEVKREIEAAIDAAYENPNFHAQCVYRAGDKPTPEEFIAHMARRASAGNGNSCGYEGGYHHQPKA